MYNKNINRNIFVNNLENRKHFYSICKNMIF